MKLVDEIFLRYKVNIDSLIPYGFIKDNNTYIYNKMIHNKDFNLIVTIKDNKVTSTLMDVNFNEEYKRIDASEISSSFVNELKSECSTILTDIRDKCFSLFCVCFTRGDSTMVTA